MLDAMRSIIEKQRKLRDRYARTAIHARFADDTADRSIKAYVHGEVVNVLTEVLCAFEQEDRRDDRFQDRA